MNVILASQVPDEFLSDLRVSFPDLVFHVAPTAQTQMEHIKDAEIFFGFRWERPVVEGLAYDPEIARHGEVPRPAQLLSHSEDFGEVIGVECSLSDQEIAVSLGGGRGEWWDPERDVDELLEAGLGQGNLGERGFDPAQQTGALFEQRFDSTGPGTPDSREQRFADQPQFIDQLFHLSDAHLKVPRTSSKA
ncbi:MAG: hypothetical protein IIA44_16070 [Acidobacteria bacterium]|nr:hypothetical protein [Acidobacteriota bacterium]